MTTVAVVADSSRQQDPDEWSPERKGWRRLARVAWLQHRTGCLGFVGVLVVVVAAIVVEELRASSAYATFVSAGCVSAHLRNTTSCNADALDLGGVAIMRTIGTALSLLPLLVAVFLGAPLVAREIESGTFRFAWTQSWRRSWLVSGTLGFLGLGMLLIGVVLGLLFGGWYAHLYLVVLPPDVSQWQAAFFLTTWWSLPLWMVLGLAVGTLLGTQIRRVVPAMAASAAVLGALMAGMFLLLPSLLGVGADVRRLPAVGGMAIGPINSPTQPGWRFPEGSWVVRSWMTGPGGHVLGVQTVQHVAYRISSRTPASGARRLALRHDAFFVSYQPPGHFWAAQAIEGIIVLALAAIVVTATLRLLRGRAGA